MTENLIDDFEQSETDRQEQLLPVYTSLAWRWNAFGNRLIICCFFFTFHDLITLNQNLYKGDKWRKKRRLLTPAFHFQILDNFLEVFNKHAEIFCDLLDEETSSSHDNAKELDMFPYLKRCTLDVICGKKKSN